VFTGGTGEHAASVRAAVCRGLAFAGVMLDKVANAWGEEVIRDHRAAVEIRIVSASEESEMALNVTELPDPPTRLERRCR
jgi:acetate kinase